MSRNWIDDMFQRAQGAVAFLANGVAKPLRKTVNIIGATIVDNPGANRLDITITGAVPSSALPQALGAAAAGAHTLFARDDHVHAHGTQAGGSLHALATTSVDGFFNHHDKAKLDAIDIDQLVMQSAWKQAVRCVVTTNVALTARAPSDDSDDVELESGDRVLLAGQTDKTQNGFWLDQGLSTPMIRPTDFDANDDVILGHTVRVTEGRQYSGSTWYLSSPTEGAPVLGTNALEYTELDVPQLKFDLDSVSAVPMRIAGRNRVVFDATSLTEEGRLVLALALTGHAEGGYLEGFIPAGLLGSDLGDTALARAGDLNADGWDAYDPASDYAFVILHTNGGFLSTGRNLGTRDTTAPTISTAIVELGDPDKLTLVFSEPVLFDLIGPLQGISLTVNTGAACTITGLIGGNGTDTVELDLSRDIVTGNDIDLVIGSTRLLQDLNGTKIATVTFPLNLGAFNIYAPPTADHIWDPRTGMHVSGSDVTSIDDSVGIDHLLSSSTKPTTATVNGKAAARIIAGSYLKAVLATSVNKSVGSFGCVISFPTNTATYEWIFAMSLASNVLLDGWEIYWYPAFTLTAQRDGVGGTAGSTSPSTGNIADTTQHALLAVWDHAEIKVYLDGTLIGTGSTSFTMANIKQFLVGIASDLSSSPATGMEFAYGFTATTKYSGSTITDWFNYAQDAANWDTP